MNTIDTLIIGGGQAGLATAYHLARLDMPCQVIDEQQRAGDTWRHTWDSLRLYSPARLDGLPGTPFPGDPHHFPGKDEVADYLEGYAEAWDLPVRHGVRVVQLDRAPDGHRFLASTTAGNWLVENVVICTGTFGRTPRIPALSADLAPDIRQLHSSEYRRPGDLPAGPVLVVGAAHSGQDIAYELAAHRPTILAGRECGSLPLTVEDPRMRVGFSVLWAIWGSLLDRRTPMGRKAMEQYRFHGGPALRHKPAELLEVGVERTEERVVGVVDGHPQLTDGRVLDVATVIWATGFQQTYDWIRLPVIGADGWPLEDRGVVASAPGLYFCGLSFQTSFRSMLLGGAGADAAYIARHIAKRVARPSTAA